MSDEPVRGRDDDGDGGDDDTGGDTTDALDPQTVLAASGEALFAGMSSRLAGYVEQCVLDRARSTFGTVDQAQAQAPAEATEEAAASAGRQAAAEVLPALRALVEADVDEQRTTPLSLLRRATTFATAALERLGVPPVARDRFAEERFPDDRYALAPASMAVLGEEVEELAIAWGAAKAMAHRRRHLGPGAEGRRDS